VTLAALTLVALVLVLALLAAAYSFVVAGGGRWALLGVVLFAFAIGGVGASRAGAAVTYATACPDPATLTAEQAVATAQACLAIAERVEDVEATSAGGASLTHTDLMIVVGAILGAGFLPLFVVHVFGVRGL
jgi:hypothetical protein